MILVLGAFPRTAPTTTTTTTTAVPRKRQQLEELRRGAAAGDAALREAAKLKNLFEGALRSAAKTPSDIAAAAAARTGAPATAAAAAAAAAAEGVEDGRQGEGEPRTSDDRVGAGSLAELADRLKRQAEGFGRELESTREALTTAR